MAKLFQPRYEVEILCECDKDSIEPWSSLEEFAASEQDCILAVNHYVASTGNVVLEYRIKKVG